MTSTEKRNHYTTVKMAPCKICGGISTGYHFGAITCEACKAFFRRAISKKSYSTYSCQREDNCANNPKTIAGCVACRLKRCLDAGMSKEGIRRGRYSIALRTKSILEAKQEQNKPLLEFTPDTNPRNSECNRPTQPEIFRSDAIKECFTTVQNRTASQENNAPPIRMTSQPKPVKSSPLDLSHPTSPPTVPHTCRAAEVSVTEKKYIEFIIDRLLTLQKMLFPHNEVTEDIVQRQKQIQEEHEYREEAFKCLFGSSDILVSASEFKEVLHKAQIELDNRLVLLREKGRAAEKNISLYIHHANFIPGFERLHKDDRLSLLKASYYEFWLFGNYASINDDSGVSGGTDGVMNAHKKVTSAFFNKDFIESTFQYAKVLQQMNFSKEEIAIIRAIVLTFTDRCSLQQPNKVENLQMLFVRCLRYHLSKTRLEPHERFFRIVDRLVGARNLSHENSHVNRDFLNDWGFFMEEYPIWRAMMESTAAS